MSPEESRKEREARSLALERAYVHDVYDQISVNFSSGRHRVWPRVRQFLLDLEPGSFVADVGCGNGKYLHVNQKVMKLGVDRCLNLTNTAKERDHQVMVSDNLALPFRDEAFDAALSIAVIHHFATTERRVRALRELARILRIGGRLMISVWAMEQRHRKFESQDVLVPWHRPEHSSSDDKTSSIERDLNSTTTDDDDVLHYHAHNHSDSDSCPSNRHGGRRNGRRRTRSRAIDPIGAASSSQSSSDLSSPNESCYSFVRRALQKLTSNRRGSSSSGKPWFLHGGSLSAFKSDMEVGGTCEPRPSLSGAGQRPSVSNDGSLDSQENLDDVPIELRHLEPEDPALLDIPQSPLPLLPPPAGVTTVGGDPEGKAKSKSLTDLVQAAPRSMGSLPGAHGTPLFPREKSVSREALMSGTSSETSSSVLRSKSSSSCLALSSRELAMEAERGGALRKVPSGSVSVGDDEEKRESVTDDDKGTAATRKRGQKEAEERTDSEKGEVLGGAGGGGDGAESADSPPPTGRKRPALKKQKASINESDTSDVETPIVIEISQVPRGSQSEAEATPEQDEDHLSIPKGHGIVKQSSLNDDFICIDRFLEKEKLKQSIQKQSSLNEDLIYGNRPERRESLRESLFTTQFRRLQNIRESFQRLRTASLDRFEKKSDSSLKKGIVKLLQSWKSEILVPKGDRFHDGTEDEAGDGEALSSDTALAGSLTDDQKHTEAQRKGQGIYQLGRSCDGGEALRTCVVEKKLLSREPSERKPSREESSDSSKENSFQSDTSLDSEDSCVSVIFVPKPGQAGTSDADKERHRSVSSESSEGSDKQHSPKSPRSPKSPKSPKSPGPGGGRYFTPNRYLGAKGGVKAGPKMGTQVLAGASRPEAQRRISPPSDSLPESTTSPTPATGPIATPASEKSKSEAAPAVVREVPTIKTVASGAPRPVLGRAACSLSRVMNHSGSTPPATPPPTITSRSYFSHYTPLPPRTATSTQPMPAAPPPQPLPPSVRQQESTAVPKALPPITAVPPPQVLPSAPTPAPSSGSSKQHIRKYEPQVVKRDSSFTQQLSSLLLGENIEIIRKTGSSGSRNVQIVRKTVPRYLTFDVFNPETDDLDSDSSASSSPNSGSSVIERGWPTEKDIEELDKEIKRREEEERRRAVPSPAEAAAAAAAAERNAPPPAEIPKLSLVEDVHRMDTISEDAREHSGSEMYGGRAGRRRNTTSSAGLTRSSSVSRAFVDQTHGASRWEAEGGKQRPASIGSAPSSFLSTSLVGGSAGAAGDGMSEASLKRSPKARRKLTIAHLDQPLSLQPTLEHKPEARRHSRSPEPLLDRQSLRNRMPERHHQQAKAVSPMGADPLARGADMKPWAEVAIKPITETVNLPPPTSWRGRYSPEGIFKGLSEFEKMKSQEARKSGLELPFGSPSRGTLSPSSSVSSTSPSVPRELGREDFASRSPLLSSPTPSTSSGESRSGSHVAMSLFREGPFSLDLFKMSRSESSLPLLSPDDHRANHGTFREPVRPLVLPGPRRNSRLEVDAENKEAAPRSQKEDASPAKEETPARPRRQHSSPLKVRIEDTKSQKESEDGKKTQCRLCARENEKRQKKRREEQAASIQQLSREQMLAGGARRRAATQGKADGPRRGELRSQGSLDSATEQKEAASARFTPPLVRSGSLDLEKAERTQKMSSLSRDTSTSQDSLQSDMGGAPTLHRYYHVFREGELDQLIEKYVHNLHIISSYYDHANWCVVAEKVQVWTI